MKNEQPIKVLIASPSYDGKFDVRYMNSLFETQKIAASHNIILLPYHLCFDSLIQRARNDYFTTAYRADVDVLFFIDSDIGWNPEDFIKIVKSDKDIIGGTYRKKTTDEELYAFKATELEGGDFILTPDKDGILEVNGLGFGFVKFSKFAVKTLWENEKGFYGGKDVKGITKNICECVINQDNDFVSEDIIVGYKWKKLGYKTYLDTTIDLIHTGNAEYTGDLRNWLKGWRVKIDKMLEDKKAENGAISDFINAQPVFAKNDTVQRVLDDDDFKVL